MKGVCFETCFRIKDNCQSSKCEPAYFLTVNYLLKVCLHIYYKLPYDTEKLLGSIATNEEKLRHMNTKQTGAERRMAKG